MKEAIAEHFSHVIRWVKSVIDDERLTDEEKVRVLGMVL